MKNIAIINGINLASYALLKIRQEKDTLKLCCEFGSSLPGVEKVILFSNRQPEQKYPVATMVYPDWTEKLLLERIAKLSQGYQTIFYFFADSPFLDTNLAGKMFADYQKYTADYSFADGYPAGLSCEIINTTILSRLLKLAGDKEPAKDTIFEVIKKDINSFDIETAISPKDYRLQRINLYADCKSNFELVRKLSSQRDAGQILRKIDSEPEILRTLPVYYAIQITRDCPQDCTYCPYPAIRKKNSSLPQEMTLADFRKILAGIQQFSAEAVIDISLWGEPANHSRIEELITAVLAYPSFKLLIETSGIGWDRQLLNRLKAQAPGEPVWIVSLDGWSKEIYRQLRGAGFTEACRTAETLLELFPCNTYIQAVRMLDNEDDLEQFFDEWKKKTENIIIQKYDDYCGRLPAKRVTDLSPVNRFPCWHLKRDLNILLDGTVTMCREDLAATCKWGNIHTDSLAAIWERGQPVYREHLAGKYRGICEKCDEYYTYNF